MRKYLLGLVIPITFVILWEILARQGFVNPLFFPAPTDTFQSGLERISDGSLIKDVSVTLTRLALGFTIGAASGYAAGLFMGLNSGLRMLFEPTLSVLYTVPKIVLLPVFLLIFGVGESSKIALISLTVFFYVWINTLSAVKNIPAEYISICNSITTRKTALIWNVIIPASLPSVFTGLRVGISVATLITISTEFVMSDSGLGHLIFNSRFLMRYEDAYTGIFLVGIIGFLLQTSIKKLGVLLTPWQSTTDNSNVVVRG